MLCFWHESTREPEALILDMDLTRLTINVPELLFLWFLDSLTLDQILALALVLVLARLRLS